MSGPDLDQIEMIQEACQDDETRGFIALAKRDLLPPLLRSGWSWRFEGEDGIGCLDLVRNPQLRLIHTIAREDDGEVWAHVSLSRRDRVMPTWEQTRDAWWLLYGATPGVIVVAPRDEHVNRAEVAHVWGCLTRRTVPDFTHGTGSI